jgi:hypothetical protein
MSNYKFVQFPDGHVYRTANPEYHPEAKIISNTEGERLCKAEAIKHLRKLLRPGSTVHCVLRHVSASGMSRRIDFYKIDKDEPLFLSGYISDVLGYKRTDKGEGLWVSGCGMDMGFAVVYALGSTIYPKGFKIPKNGRRRNGDQSGFDEDGGYALKSSWI